MGGHEVWGEWIDGQSGRQDKRQYASCPDVVTACVVAEALAISTASDQMKSAAKFFVIVGNEDCIGYSSRSYKVDVQLLWPPAQAPWMVHAACNNCEGTWFQEMKLTEEHEKEGHAALWCRYCMAMTPCKWSRP